MKRQKLYPLVLIYPLGPPEGLRFSACLKTRCSNLVVSIEMTYTNRTGQTVYLPRCIGVLPPSLQKRGNGEWLTVYEPVVPMCIGAPVEVEPGEKYIYTFTMWACLLENCSPKLEVNRVEGTYRLVWEIYETWMHGGNASGPGRLLPLVKRVSNKFSLSE